MLLDAHEPVHDRGAFVSKENTDASTETTRSADRDHHDHPLRMKDLCEASGLDRQAIHFYIQQGLLPAGKKTGRNMAWYSDAHVERLLLIKKLQHERFLPLKAIKAMLDGREEEFAPAQHRFLVRLKGALTGPLAPEERGRTIAAAIVLERSGVERRDLDEAIELDLVASQEIEGELHIAEADAWMIDLFGQMRKLGFTRDLGFTVRDVAFYQDAMMRLFREEIRLLSRRLSHLPADDVAPMIEQALPVIHTFITRYHGARVRDFFASVEDEPREP